MNILKGEVPLSLPDKRCFTLTLNHEALISAEAAYGKPLNLLMQDMAMGFVGAVRALLWAALQSRHPEIDRTVAAEILFEHGEEVQAALNAAAEAAAPAEPRSTEGNEPSRQAGKTSGGSGARSGSTRKRSSRQRREATR
ncbi:hypothetical protein [Qipengyuania sp.]|uniref:hypothetical protein n=1 Tax=Qipengyuania sp. TaxID=2004515 RepID=UPI0035C81EC3